MKQQYAEITLQKVPSGWLLTDCSPEFLEMTGFTRSGLWERFRDHFMPMLSGSDLPAADELFDFSSGSKSICPWIFLLKCAEAGRTLPVLLQKFSDGCQKNALLVRVHDASFLGEHTTKMGRRFLALEESVPSGFCQVLFDDSFTVLWHNHYFLEMLGYTEEQFVNELHSCGAGYVYAEDIPEIQKQLSQAFSQGQRTFATEMRVVRRDGEILWLFTSFSFTEETVNGIPVLYSMGIDLTAQKRARQLELDAECLRLAMNQASNYILEYDVATHRLYSTNGLQKYFGFDSDVENAPESLIESGVVLPESAETARALFRQIEQGDEYAEGVVGLHGDFSDSTNRWFRMRLSSIYDDAGRPVKAILLAEDITEHHRIELRFREEENRRVAMTYDMNFSFQINLSTGKIISAHEEKYPFFDFSRSDSANELIRKNADLCVHPEDRTEYLQRLGVPYMLQQLENGIPEITLEFRITRHNGDETDGEWLWRKGIIHIIREPQHGEVYAYLYTKDINEEKKHELELRRSAEQDALTGLYNRYTVELIIDRFLKQKPADTLSAMYMLDLDNFKKLNEIYGHARGDDMLRDTAQRLRETFDDSVILGRLGGDELVVFQPNCLSVTKAEHTARHLCNALRGLDSSEGVVTASVGLAFSPENGRTFADLYQCADKALYQAKRSGKNGWAMFAGTQEKSVASDRLPVSREWLLEESSDLIYVCDFYSYDLLYMNQNARKEFGVENGDYLDRKCYNVLQQKDQPCEFCTNHLLCRECFYCWENRSETLGKSYLLRDRVIDWYGVPARIEFATDVSQIDNRNQELQRQLDIDHLILSCLQIINSEKTFDLAAEAVLQQLCDFYVADRSFIFEYIPTQNILQPHWEKSRAGHESVRRYMGDGIHPGAYLQECIQEHKTYLYCKDTADRTEDCETDLREAGVTLRYCVPFYINGHPAGIVGLDNPTAYADKITVLETLAYSISEELSRSRLSDRLSFLSFHDSLTGLWNRNRYVEYMTELKNRTITSFGIAIADLNALKDINKLRGHAQGDLVVKRAADLLRTNFPDAQIFRLSGDEFVIHCENLDRFTFLDQVKCAREMAPTLQAHGISVGYAWTDREIDWQMLTLQATDIMMMQKREYYQHEKENYSSGKHDHARLQELLDNLQKGYFTMYLQPKADCSAFQLSGAEALVRFQSPETGLVPPDRFIPLLEQEHIIRYVDLFIFEEVCKLLARWKAEGRELLPISLNFSRQTALEPDLLKTMLYLTEHYQIPQDCIEVEITESLGEYESSTIADIGAGIKAAGFRLALDDFGSHYTNMAMLSVVPADVLKLDRGLVRDVLSSHSNQLVLKYILSLCREMNISSIAEGVETEEQLELLRSLQCDAIQGYLFGRPIPVDEFEARYLQQSCE